MEAECFTCLWWYFTIRYDYDPICYRQHLLLQRENSPRLKRCAKFLIFRNLFFVQESKNQHDRVGKHKPRGKSFTVYFRHIAEYSFKKLDADGIEQHTG